MADFRENIDLIGGLLTITDGVKPYTFPASDGVSGQTLTTDGAGNMVFTTPSGGGGSHPIISDEVIPKGDGTTVENGKWAFSGDGIYPLTDMSNIGTPTRGVDTLYMASKIDFRSNLEFINGGSTKMVIETGGNVGIGKTPTKRLDVSGDVNIDGDLTINNTTYDALKINRTTGTLISTQLQLSGITKSGFHHSSVNDETSLTTYSGDLSFYNGTRRIKIASDGAVTIGAGAGSGDKLNVQGTARLDGYVGILKTPTSPLDVNGDVNIDGDLTINNTTYDALKINRTTGTLIATQLQLAGVTKSAFQYSSVSDETSLTTYSGDLSFYNGTRRIKIASDGAVTIGAGAGSGDKLNVQGTAKMDGYVGILKTPTSPLDVNGDVNIDGDLTINNTTYDALKINRTTGTLIATQLQLSGITKSAFGYSSVSDETSLTTYSGDLSFYNGTRRIKIASDGAVTIGAGAGSGDKFNVQGVAKIDNKVIAGTSPNALALDVSGNSIFNGRITLVDNSSTTTTDGTIRYFGGDFEGRKAGVWTSMTSEVSKYDMVSGFTAGVAKTINHNLGTDGFTVQVRNDSGQVVLPDIDTPTTTNVNITVGSTGNYRVIIIG